MDVSHSQDYGQREVQRQRGRHCVEQSALAETLVVLNIAHELRTYLPHTY